jgi:hypothetical protein
MKIIHNSALILLLISCLIACVERLRAGVPPTAGAAARQWQGGVPTGEAQLAVQTTRADPVTAVAFNPEGKPDPSASRDHTIRLRDGVTGPDPRSLGTPAEFSEQGFLPAQGAEEINDANWQRHPKIMAIRKIVNSINEGLKRRAFKTSERQFESCPDTYFTMRRIARDAKGRVAWYEDYSEGEDSSWDYHQYYDQAGRLRFALIIVYAANGTREQHRAYFDESGRLIRQSRKLLKGPGYFAPYKVEDLVKDDPARQFADDEGCVAIKPKPGRRGR